MSLTVRMRSSSGGSLSTGEVWDRHTCIHGLACKKYRMLPGDGILKLCVYMKHINEYTDKKFSPHFAMVHVIDGDQMDN